MQPISLIEKRIAPAPAKTLVSVQNLQVTKTSSPVMITGLQKTLVKTAIWINILFLAFWHYKNPVTAIKALSRLKKMRSDFRGKYPVMKYAKTGGKYYFTSNAPGWPSKNFNGYVLNNIKKMDAHNNEVILNTILFGITKKCGYQCEHCFEWEALNKPEVLSRENILKVISSFQQVGIRQVHLSGGEPLNRFDDIIYILQNIKRGTDVWLYTSGYQFTADRAATLKREGLTGITVSLDHWIPELHNTFRGRNNAFEWAEKAVANATANGLVVCLCVCATKSFTTENNLAQYAELAREWGASFIQVLEPRAVGHYVDKDVALNQEQIKLLEDFYINYNYSKARSSYPLIIYHSFYSRRISCGGSANYYVYIDTDGDVHNCPFCQKKIFSALKDDLKENLRLMATGGCNAFIKSAQKN